MTNRLKEQFEACKRNKLLANAKVELLDQQIEELQAQVETMRLALLAMRNLAMVADDGDPWYAENAGIDAEACFALARKALGESSPAKRPSDG